MVQASTQTQFEKHKSVISAKLFTPNMIFVASLFGGPLGGCLLMAANYRAIGQKESALKTLVWAVGGMFLLFVVNGFISSVLSGLSGPSLHIGIAVGLRQWAKSTFDWEYPKASWWIVRLVTGLGFVLTVAVAIGYSFLNYLFLGIGKSEILETYINPIETRQIVLIRSLVIPTMQKSSSRKYAYRYRTEVVGKEQEKKVIFRSYNRPEFKGWIDKETIEYIDGFAKCKASLFSSSKPICKEDADLKKDNMRRIINLDQDEIDAKQVKNPPIHKATNYLRDTRIESDK